MIKNTNCAKGMLVLRGPHVITGAELYPFSKNSLCSISLSCISVQLDCVLFSTKQSPKH